MLDAFEEHLQTFNGTIYGPDMRESLYGCFSMIVSEIKHYDDKIREARDKIKKLEEEE